jgi:predicted nuclease of predicted toxin-antitoxin system
MNVLADENVERAIVEYLRGLGHDVLYAAEAFAATPDPEVLLRASAEKRVVLTNDLDFGELVYHQRLRAEGILLLRLQAPSLNEKVALFRANWPLIEGKIAGHFVVVTNRRIRLRPLG